MQKDDQAAWIVKTCEKIIDAMRKSGGIPSIVNTGYLTVSVPTLAEQADVMNAMSVSWIVDITSMLALIELVVAAIMVRRLRKG